MMSRRGLYLTNMDYEIVFRDKDAAWFVHNRVKGAYQARQLDHNPHLSVRDNILTASEAARHLADKYIEKINARVKIHPSRK